MDTPLSVQVSFVVNGLMGVEVGGGGRGTGVTVSAVLVSHLAQFPLLNPCPMI